MKGFAVAGKDGVFRWAEAKIHGSSAVVWHKDVPEPLSVRYGWADNPFCDLIGKNGLPAEPFRTDRPVEP